MTAAEQESFTAAAVAEQGLREEAMREPWDAKLQPKEPQTQTIDLLSKNATKKVSRHRTVNSYARFKAQTDWWSEQGSGVSCPDGIMQLDHVDLQSTDEDLQRDFAQFAETCNNANNAPLPSLQGQPTNRAVCSLHQCQSGRHFALAANFVDSMSHLLATGTCAEF